MIPKAIKKGDTIGVIAPSNYVKEDDLEYINASIYLMEKLGLKVKFGKYIFNSFKEFQDVQNLAIASGLETMKEFTEFLSANYSHKLVK